MVRVNEGLGRNSRRSEPAVIELMKHASGSLVLSGDYSRGGGLTDRVWPKACVEHGDEEFRPSQSNINADDGPVVQINSGALKGSLLKAKGKDTTIHSYLGIPFAKPPVGKLRLAPPQPAEKWDDVRDATKQPLMCLQEKKVLEDLMTNLSMKIDIVDSAEDCLYLNVYTPSKPGAGDKLPVMVWIHGGGFSMASASIFDGHVLSAYEDVVVVVIQYRLAPVMNMRRETMDFWIRWLLFIGSRRTSTASAEILGRSPSLESLLEESVLSPLSANLFHYAIAESGTAGMDAIMTFDPLPMAQALGNISGCDISSTKQIVDCVMQMSEEDLLTISTENPLLRFGVTVDGHFIPKPVDELLQSHEFSKVPLMTGITNDECGFLLPNFVSSPEWIHGMDLEEILPFLIMFNPVLQDQSLLKLVVTEYMGTSPDRIRVRDGFREMLGDFMFNIPARKVANHHRDAGAPVFAYEFQHAPSIIQKKRPSFVGSDHGDEIIFVFGYCFSGQIVMEEIQMVQASQCGLNSELRRRPTVHTKLGSLRGSFMMPKGKETVVSSYFGVPFAKPPVGTLRLAPPQPAEAWEGVRDATKQPPMCLQPREVINDLLLNMSMSLDVPEVSEDCLYLNIYTPSKPGDDRKLPVMVWIHGGGYAFGSASVFDAHPLAAYQDVVVVLVQYRLGLLGFFSTGDEHAPGNYGLLDQVAALQWVQENIHSFGGDPGSVTIFGESAGGVSVSLLVLSPLSANLFHAAIAESGVATMDAIMSPNPLPTAQFLGQLSGCDVSSTRSIVDCVMQLSEEDLLKTAREQLLLRFGVTVDGHFLPKPAVELLKSQEFHRVPLMTGVTDDEGGLGLPDILAPPGWRNGMTREEIKPFLLLFNHEDPGLAEIVLNEYLGSTLDKIKLRDGFREILGDVFFNIPARKVADSHRDAGLPVYVYEFQHSLDLLKKKRPSFVGADHADELLFVFGYCFGNGHIKVEGEISAEESELCRTVMSYWGNFAHTRNPNGPGLVEWPKYGSEAEYLGIGLQQNPGTHFKGIHFKFITEKLPQIITETNSAHQVRISERFLHDAEGQRNCMGTLRLAPPQPAEAWEGVRDATKQPPMCLQPREVVLGMLANTSMSTDVPEVSEDCLYLNIYTPSKPGDNRKLPVMFWIHGGSFLFGSASIFDAHVLASYQDVVVVEAQYRLGLLGFFRWLLFSGSRRTSTTSVEILDQSPSSESLLEESILSPLSANLFHRAIAQSGTAAMEALLSPNPRQTAQEGLSIYFKVTVDGHFLHKPVDELLQSHEFNKVPLMTGVNDDDGGFTIPNFLDAGIGDFLLNDYVGASDDRIKLRDAFREINGDFFFNIPTRKVANHHRDAGLPVYVYEFQHPPSVYQNKRPSFVGSDHGDELLFAFGDCFANGHVKVEGEFTEKENELCRTTMSYWGNFARPIVKTKSGSLRGSFLTVKGKETIINGYLAVPFAKPPVGPLRLARPEPAEKWEGVRDATKQPPMCLQDREANVIAMGFLSMDVEIPQVSEDCLYLNIYTPVEPGVDAKLPVMVWIHGGGLALGSASVYDGSVLAAYQDVVVVLVQYRLGLMGFLRQ
ncbi:hypothetical protein DNTS_017485, partial [Danionella cerebrum]